VRIGRIDPIVTVKRTVQEVVSDDVGGLAAELAYRFFLSLFPFFIFLAALGSFVAGLFHVANPTDEIMARLSQTLPPDAAGVVRNQLQKVIGSHSVGLLSIGILGAIWAASSGFRTVMKAMNRAYDVDESRTFWKRYLLSIGLTLLAGTSVILAFVMLVVGQVFGAKIADHIGLGSEWAVAVKYGYWPVAILLVLTAVDFLFWAAPNIGLPFRWLTLGSVVFIVGWAAVTYLFGLYLANFESYNDTYGTLGGVVVLLLWFYFIGYILLVGAEINRVIDEQLRPGDLEQRRQEIGREHARPGSTHLPAVRLARQAVGGAEREWHEARRDD
jgi:membrane protein